MKRVFLLAAAILAGCSPSTEDGAVLLYDQGYAISIVLDNEDGITSPDGLWWDNGALYIADEGGSAVRRWDGHALETLADASSGIASPEDLLVDSDGQVWFTDDTAGGLWRVTPGGAERVADSQGIAESEGIALRGDGTLWVGDGRTGRIHAFGPDGSAAQAFISGWQVAKPESMALSLDGALWLADNREDRLLRIDADGSVREWRLPDDLSPESIAIDGETLWITDSHNGRLYRLRKDREPEIVALFLADFANINGVAADNAGTIYVSIQSDLAAGKGYVVRMVPATGRKG
jgi:sugar lactone lactonase YvrE